jgi:hypothetical protein
VLLSLLSKALKPREITYSRTPSVALEICNFLMPEKSQAFCIEGRRLVHLVFTMATLTRKVVRDSIGQWIFVQQAWDLIPVTGQSNVQEC